MTADGVMAPIKEIGIRMRNLIYRLLTSAILLPIIIYIFYKGSAYLALLLMLVAFLCAFELANMILPNDSKAIFYSVLQSLGILGPFLLFDKTILMIAFVSITFFVFNLGFLFCHEQKNSMLEKQSTIFHFNIYVALALASICWLEGSPELISRSTGLCFIILACLSTWANDTFAYFGGRFFGKNPLFKRVSAKKTWEGFITGGLGSLILVAAIFGLLSWSDFIYLRELTWADCLFIAIPGIILAPLGDLIESRLKRAYEIKDSSNILPGHGGIFRSHRRSFGDASMDSSIRFLYSQFMVVSKCFAISWVVACD